MRLAAEDGVAPNLATSHVLALVARLKIVFQTPTGVKRQNANLVTPETKMQI
jgi:hypothetical protein